MTNDIELTEGEELAVRNWRWFRRATEERKMVCRWIRLVLTWGLPLAISMWRQDAADLLQHLASAVGGAPKR